MLKKWVGPEGSVDQDSNSQKYLETKAISAFHFEMSELLLLILYIFGINEFTTPNVKMAEAKLI